MIKIKYIHISPYSFVSAAFVFYRQYLRHIQYVASSNPSPQMTIWGDINGQTTVTSLNSTWKPISCYITKWCSMKKWIISAIFYIICRFQQVYVAETIWIRGNLLKREVSMRKNIPKFPQCFSLADTAFFIQCIDCTKCPTFPLFYNTIKQDIYSLNTSNLTINILWSSWAWYAKNITCESATVGEWWCIQIKLQVPLRGNLKTSD